MDVIEYDTTSSQPVEDQFWDQFDGVFGLTEEGLKKDLGVFITDARDRSKVEAILNNKSNGIAKEKSEFIC